MKTNMYRRAAFLMGMIVSVMFVANAKNGSALVEKSSSEMKPTVEYIVTGVIPTSILTPTKYDFTYDNQDRLVEKKVYKWNETAETWVNEFTYQYIYLDNGYITEEIIDNNAAISYEPYADIFIAAF